MTTPSGPLEAWLSARGDAPLLRWAVETLIGPVLDVLLVVAVAWIALRLVGRGLDRALAGMRDPSGAVRSSRWRRLGETEPAAAASPRRLQRAEALAALARSAVSAVVWSLAALISLGTLGVELGPLVAGAGVVGVALGFGAQHVVRDLLAGVSMLIEDQYGVGDVIDVGDAVGVVEGISLRSTRVRSIDGTLWHVPNGEIRRVGNMSQGWSRAVLDVAIAYDADVEPVLELLGRLGAEIADDATLAPFLLADPEVVGVEALGADGVTVRMTVRTVPGEQWRVTRELRRRVKATFDAAGIEIPFPQRTVHLRREDTPGASDEG
ncbi:MAG: hypothetical protein RLZZ272_1192 [Actinomycetota bacterium]|jgi:small conductance mechanosensitive channel